MFCRCTDCVCCSDKSCQPDDHVECLKQILLLSGLVSARHEALQQQIDEVKDTFEDTVAMSQPAKKRKIIAYQESGAA
jgi:hypothetical protein